MAEMNLPTGEPLDPLDSMDSTGGRPIEATENFTVTGIHGLTAPGRPAEPIPKLIATTKRRQSPTASVSPSVATPAPSAPLSAYLEPAEQARRFAVVLNPIKSIVPVGRLIGIDSGELTISPDDFTRAVVEYAADGNPVPQLPGDICQQADGNWACLFPSTVPATVVPIKMGVIREQWGLTIEQPEPTRFILRRTTGGGGWFSGKKSGVEVQIRLPNLVRTVGEIALAGGLFGSPDRGMARQAMDLIPKLMAHIRRELKNVDDRRRHARAVVRFQVTLYPIHSDGGIDVPIFARGRDVSVGGLCVVTDAPLPTKYAYAAFDGIGPTGGQAILVRFLRSQPVNRECVSGGQYRIDL